jgi:hypothetical protein
MGPPVPYSMYHSTGWMLWLYLHRYLYCTARYVPYLLDLQYLSPTAAAPSSSSSITHSVFQQPHKSSSLLLATSFCALHITSFFLGRGISSRLACLCCSYIIVMSSSIDIPSRSAAYGDGGKAAASSSSSSPSSYSASPRTPQNQSSTASSTPNTKYGHDRRPSLLSKSYCVPPGSP